MGAPLIEAKGICKTYAPRGLFRRKKAAIRALDGIDLSIGRGEIFGLVGESGSGKSTLARILLSLEHADKGAVFWEGYPLSERRAAGFRDYRTRVQMIFQDSYGSFNPRKTVWQIAAAPLAERKALSLEEKRERLEALFYTVGIEKTHWNAFPHMLSGGQRQRVAIARSLAARPDFVVCDEPISSLDMPMREAILSLISGLARENRTSFLLISHDLRAVSSQCARVAVMYSGKIVELADAKTLFESPRHPYTKELLSSSFLTSKKDKIECAPVSPWEHHSLCEMPGCPFYSRCQEAEVCCAQTPPRLSEVSNGHKVACHFAREEHQKTHGNNHKKMDRRLPQLGAAYPKKYKKPKGGQRD